MTTAYDQLTHGGSTSGSAAPARPREVPPVRGTGAALAVEGPKLRTSVHASVEFDTGSVAALAQLRDNLQRYSIVGPTGGAVPLANVMDVSFVPDRETLASLEQAKWSEMKLNAMLQQGLVMGIASMLKKAFPDAEALEPEPPCENAEVARLAHANRSMRGTLKAEGEAIGPAANLLEQVINSYPAEPPQGFPALADLQTAYVALDKYAPAPSKAQAPAPAPAAPASAAGKTKNP